MAVYWDIALARDTTDAIINPVLVVKVLSPSTEFFDRGRKFEHYRIVQSLRKYVLISQGMPIVGFYFKGDWIKSWTF